MNYDYIIGIDPGVNTGYSVWNCKAKSLDAVDCLPIHEAMELVKNAHGKANILVRFEDARLRKWFGNSGREQLQGAGSIKRDCGIWEAYLKSLGIPYTAVAPKNNKTKLDAKTFERLTGWHLRTNEHSRDSAMLVFGIEFLGNYIPIHPKK